MANKYTPRRVFIGWEDIQPRFSHGIDILHMWSWKACRRPSLVPPNPVWKWSWRTLLSNPVSVTNITVKQGTIVYVNFNSETNDSWIGIEQAMPAICLTLFELSTNVVSNLRRFRKCSPVRFICVCRRKLLCGKKVHNVI